MSTPNTGLAIIREFEGLRLRPYRCPAGLWTQGYGRTRGITATAPAITPATAEEWLRQDAAAAEAIVRANVKVPLGANQLGALTSFVFNVGPGSRGYKDGFVWLKSGGHSSMLRLLNEGDMQRAAQQFDHWVSAKGVKLPGLERRRAAEKALFLAPVSQPT